MLQRRVCIFVRNPFTNDARVLRESSALAEAGYEVDVIATYDRKNLRLPKEEALSERLTIYRIEDKTWQFTSIFVGTGFILLSFLSIWAVFWAGIILLCLLGVRKGRALIRYSCVVLQMLLKGMSKQYDIYHANDLDTLPQGVICAKVLRKKKLVYDSHEIQVSRTGYFHSLYGIIEKCFIDFADEYIHENHTRATYIARIYGIYPKVIHNYPVSIGLNKGRDFCLHQKLDIPREEPLLLYQGGLQEGRGLEQIVEATPLFKRGVVVFIGDGLLKEKLVQMVQDRKLEARIKFIPKVPLRELATYTKEGYIGFQVLNNTCFNHYSASSNKLFEYMMSLVPVIACDFPEIKGVVEKERVGICVDSHNPASIAQAVNELLEHPEIRERMSRNCLRARGKYSWEKEKKVFLKIYARLFRSSY